MRSKSPPVLRALRRDLVRAPVAAALVEIGRDRVGRRARRPGFANGRPVGFVAVALNAFHERMGVIDIIGVDPAYQRRGISSRLTEFATEHMRSRGMDIAVVETGGDPGHQPARAAYEAAGFTLLPIARYFRLLD